MDANKLRRLLSDRRIHLIFCIAAAAVAAQALGLYGFLSMEALARNRDILLNFVGEYRFSSILIFVAAYVAMVSLSLPGSQMLTITGGFLFGTILGAALAVAGATSGAAVLFLVIRRSIGVP